MKGIQKHILVLALSLTVWAGLTATAWAYTDVPAGHWAAESIEKATSLGIFNGIEEGRFGLGQPITRAEFAAVLVRFFGWENTARTSSYTDVSPDAWYAAAVETARANSAVAAAGREFHPEEAVTRAEMASMLLRSLGYTYLAGAASEYSAPFSDVTVNRGFITLAYDLGLMTGTGEQRFDPNLPAAREQAAAVLVRVYDQLETAPVRLDSAAGYRTISVPTPMAQAGTEIPITPLEPLTDLYAALRRLRYSEENMGEVVLRLTAGGVETLTGEDGRMTSNTLTAAEVREALALPDAKTYYSEQYESAYCIYRSGAGQTATLWYQNEESMAAKLQLAQLFGVGRYLLE